MLAAAASLFVEQGFERATMTEIASRAGASIGSLYLFFPTKEALAQTLLVDLAEVLSTRLDQLQLRVAWRSAAEIGDALFDEIFAFLAEHPVYAVLIDLRGDDAWKHAVRARRRSQIAALFAAAEPPLKLGQPERLAAIVPELLRFAMVVSGRVSVPPRGEVLDELRAMLRHHLEHADGTTR